MIARLKRWLFRLVLLALGLPIVLVATLKFIDPPVWGWKIHRSLFPPAGYPAQTTHLWTELRNISPNVQLAVIASEDQRFPSHHGIDVNAVLGILKKTGTNGPERGGSTITQQTAKNLFLFPARSFVRKGVELYFALLMELIWDKQRILEVYLNIIEFGPGLYGVEAASQNYFAIPSNRLSTQQAAQLAAVLPNPYTIKANPMSAYVSKRSRWITRQMRQLGKGTLNLL
ncbi:monofunctional biosynthetic peptidoglycan transglycosylase [Photobacterium proteolyticum]|uniref:Biosynthetic peptidoglycan transglycosylase n=1 Tax=Photobacterium proteolyticum TaxID=1903952 RepID=A0A1Q9GKN4_9GAMM|nr:monofunctional biosynthetic peptidoglycan transglycosylase [Photobacterium proteolyticum]